MMKKTISMTTAAALSLGLAALLPQSLTASAYSDKYAVQEFRFGIGDTNRSISISAQDSGAYASSVTPEDDYTRDSKWSLNFISTGVYEIVNSATGMLLTNDSGVAVISPDVDGDNQRWSIDGVEKDSEGYMLYYKVTASDGTALTFSPESNSLSTEDYAGDTYQKFKLNLDGLQGYAANCIVDGKEKAGTIGGLLGDTVFVSTPDEMKTAMAKDEPLTIVMTKDMEFHPYGQVEIKSNKTLTSYYGLTLKDCQLRTAPTDTNQAPYDNLVFRNLRILAKDSTNCMMFNIYSSRQLWIDHCTFDSQLPKDVGEVGKFIWCNSAFDGAYKSRATDFITLSYCKFYNRYWTTLFASVSYEVPSNEKIRCRISLLYCFYDQCVRRCPQLGSAYGHIVSGFWRGMGENVTDGIDQIIGGGQTDVVSQNCRFEAIASGHEICAGGGDEPYRDDNSYTAKDANTTPSKLNFSGKVTSTRHPETENYGYTLVDPVGTYNTKDFCLKYSCAGKSYDEIKYITDADMQDWIQTCYPDFFLKEIECGNEPVKGGAKFDTALDYAFKNVGSGLYLEIADGNAQQSDTGAKLWTLDVNEEGWYTLCSKADGSYLTVEGDGNNNGANIAASEKSGTDGQLFKFVKNADGSYTIVTKTTDGKSAVGITGGSTEPGANAMQWVRDNTDNQKWNLEMTVPPLNGKLIKALVVEDLSTYQSWSIDEDAQIGDLVFGDRDVTYTVLPDALVGAEMIVTACDAKNSTEQLATFTAGADMSVYVALDTRVTSAPAWLAAWDKTDLTLTNNKDVAFTAYRLDVKAGDTVTLGTNGQSAGCVNYTVFAVQDDSTPAPVKGDANDDGQFAVIDIVMLQKWLLNAGDLTNWQNADMNEDGVIDVFDLALMKRALLAQGH